MNIENVSDRLMVLADIDSEEMFRCRALVEDACDHVRLRCKTAQPDAAQERRLEALCAAYAWKLYSLRGGALTQFIAGDVHLTSAGSGSDQAERYWQELLRQNSDLVKTDDFLFGRVMT